MSTHTRICWCDCCCLRKIAIPRVPSCGLVQKIHGIGGVRCYSVWQEASTTWLDWGAVNALATGIVKIWLQLGVWCPSFGHAPTSRFTCRRRRVRQRGHWSPLRFKCNKFNVTQFSHDRNSSTNKWNELVLDRNRLVKNCNTDQEKTWSSMQGKKKSFLFFFFWLHWGLELTNSYTPMSQSNYNLRTSISCFILKFLNKLWKVSGFVWTYLGAMVLI